MRKILGKTVSILFIGALAVALLNACGTATSKPQKTDSDNSSVSVASDVKEVVNEAKYSNESALAFAIDYLSFSTFSYKSLIKQLIYESYSEEQAAYAADNCGADWKEQALKTANNHLSFTGYSYEGLKSQLEYEGFVEDEVDYAMENIATDWNENAKIVAQKYIDITPFTKEELIEQLKTEGFTDAEAEFGAAAVGY